MHDVCAFTASARRNSLELGRCLDVTGTVLCLPLCAEQNVTAGVHLQHVALGLWGLKKDATHKSLWLAVGPAQSQEAGEVCGVHKQASTETNKQIDEQTYMHKYSNLTKHLDKQIMNRETANITMIVVAIHRLKYDKNGQILLVHRQHSGMNE